MNFRNIGHGDGDRYSQRREEIAKGKRHVDSDSDFEVDDEMEDVDSPRDVRDEGAVDGLTEEEMKILRILLDMKLGGTKYPDRDTMGRLRITDDVDDMLNNLGIGAFMFKKYESYRKATCLFIATLQLHLCAPGKFTQDGSDGYISFWLTGRRRILSFREIDRAHYLPPSNRHGLDVDRDEMSALWATIASGEYLSSDAKSSRIRSPPIRYLHKALANTIYSRHATGTVNMNEMCMIAVALTGILPRMTNGMKLKGSKSNGGITRTLIEQLRSYQSWALLNESNRHQCELRMGGLVTPLLHAVGFSPDMTEDVAPPEEIDLNYLKNCHFLQKTPDGGDLIYQFTHLQFGKARMLLPNPGWTAIRAGSNVDFNPPLSVLRIHSTPQTNRDRSDQSQGEVTEPMDAFDLFHFSEYTSTSSRQSAGLKAAHEHISLLQRWNKAQDKMAIKLKRKVKKMADQIKTLQDKLTCTSTSGGVRRSAVPVNTQPMELSGDELDHDTTGDRHPPPDQPRHSSFEPRQRKRRTREHQTARPSTACADTDLPFRRCTSASRPTPPADHSTPPSSAQTQHYVPQSTARAGSSTIPPYTQDSMNEEIDALLHGRR